MKYHAWWRQVLGFLAKSPGSPSYVWLSITVLSSAALALLTLRNGAIHIMAPWDVIGLLEGGWRSFSGLIPHTDFYDPVGSLTYELIALGMRVGGATTSSIMYSILFFALIFVPWTWFVTSHRLSGFMAMLVTVFACVLIVAARPLGYDSGVTTYAMIYNRYCWVLLSILMIQVFVAPRNLTKRGGMLEGVSIGALLLFLFYCKVSYFGIGMATVAVGMVLRPSLLRALGYVAGTFFAGCFLWWVLLDISTFDYLSDLWTAATAQSSGHRARFMINSLKANVWQIYVMLTLWLVVLVVHFRSPGRSSWLSRKLRLSIALAFVLLSTFLIAATNAPEGSDLPLFFVMGVIIIEFVSRYAKRDSTPTLSASEVAHIFALLIVIPTFALPIVTKDAMSIYYATKWKDYRESTAPESQIFDAQPLSDFIIPHTSEWQTAYWRAKNMPARINEGLALLGRHVDSDTRLFVMAFTDPFSFALQLPSPKGPPLWWDIDFSVRADAFPEPDAIFRNVNMVIIPILHDEDDGCCKGTVYRMKEVYGAFIDEHFEEIERTENWNLFARRR